jgi:hypothetical protein
MNDDPRRAAVIRFSRAENARRRLWEQYNLMGNETARLAAVAAQDPVEDALKEIGELTGQNWVSLGQSLASTVNVEEIMNLLEIISPRGRESGR